MTPATPADAVVLPGFHDHHLHLLSAAARRLSVDLSGARRVADAVAALRAAAAVRPPGAWIRAWGYDDAFLVEGRDLTRRDLDRATPAHPLVVRHRAGHVAVLNGCALRRLGLDAGGDGVLVDAHRALAGVPRQDDATLDRAAADLSAQLAAHGVTAVTDATATNDRAALERLAGLVAGGHVRQRVQAMVGAAHVPELAGQGVRYGSVLGGVRVGHAKLELCPDDDPAAVRAMARRCAEAGWPMALHVVDLVEADVALDVLEAVPAPRGTRHRIEHLALSLPEHVARLARCGAMVVSNPGFLAARGAKYRVRLGDDERGWLYRVASLAAAGVPVRAGSDAPVTEAEPLAAMAAAVERRGGGIVLAPAERVTPRGALRLFAPEAPSAGDRVVLSHDPRRDPRRFTGLTVLETHIGGKRTFAAPTIPTTRRSAA